MNRKVMMRLQFKLATLLISAVIIAGCGGSSGGGGSEGGESYLIFDSFQAASVVIGQVDFFNGAVNQGGAAAADTVSDIYGNPVVHNDILYLSDIGNHRVLGFNRIPAINGASADFVLGQADFTTTNAALSQAGMSGPASLSVDDDKLFLTDYDYDRITIYDPVPVVGPGLASVVVGQPDFTTGGGSAGDSGLSGPPRSIAVDGRLVVADKFNNRVMIWNTIPVANGVAADIVLGQSTFDKVTANDDNQDDVDDGTPSARTLDTPAGVWSDGTKLVVLDRGNNRVLIWNSFPTANFTPADLVLGQEEFTTGIANNGGISASSLALSYGAVFSKNGQLFVADHGNNRVLIWNAFPTTNFAPADVVLGQFDFTGNTENDADNDGVADGTPSATTLFGPSGLYVEGSKLIVADRFNHRYLIYEAL